MAFRTFRILKARKAKFGFQTHVSPETIPELAQVIAEMKPLDEDVLFETNFNMSANEFKVYTNNEVAAQHMRDNFCLPSKQ